MLPQYKRIESVCSSLDKAFETADRVMQYRLVIVLLRLILEEHKALKDSAESVGRMLQQCNNMDTKTVHSEYYYQSGRRRSGHWIGTAGDMLRRLNTDNFQHYKELLEKSRVVSIEFNQCLTLLYQYAGQWHQYRERLLESRPNNLQQRLIQNLLLTTLRDSSDTHNPVCGVISGEFVHRIDSRLNCITAVLRKLIDNKGLIGRRSISDGKVTLKRISNGFYNRCNESFDRLASKLTGKYGKSTRLEMVLPYTTQSERYRTRLAWMKDVTKDNVLVVLQYCDEWKVKYRGTDKLARLQAVNPVPYVFTIVTSQTVDIGNVELGETVVPVLRSKCIHQQGYREPTFVNSMVYFLGKTGSAVIDSKLKQIDWFHRVGIDDSDAITIFNHRLAYLKSQEQTLKERRKEIAAYARKLVWLNTINMLDSKSAGNCLPGTIQFCQQLGVPVPSEWNNYSADCRLLLRRWKEKKYDANRLFFPAIDAAVKRVKEMAFTLNERGEWVYC